MSTIDDYILGNDVLHDQFSVTIQIVGKAACNAPEPVTLAQLKLLTGRPEKELRKLCDRLSLSSILESRQDGWTFACDPRGATLEDVFRCILAEQLHLSRQSNANQAQPNRYYRDVELLLMQLSISVNQSVFLHLRQFTLERLKLSVIELYPFREQPVLKGQHRP